MTGSGGYLGRSGVLTVGGSGGGGGGGWVGPYHLAYTDFVAGTNGFYANVATLTAGWLISDVLAVNVNPAFSAFANVVYWGVDTTDYLSHAASQAWLSYSVGIDLTAADENSILSGVRATPLSFRSLRAACDSTPVSGAGAYDFLAATVTGSGHVLRAWVGAALTTGACDIYLLVSTPTTA